MTIDGIRTSAAMLSYYQRLEQIAANNLANVATDGFKVARVIAEGVDGLATPVPTQLLDLSQGAVRETGRALDVAIEGSGFLVVDVDGEELLTRAGSLQVDDGGFLVDLNGAQVQGQGGPISVNGGEVGIRADGTVLVNGSDVGKLRIVDVEDVSTLSNAGANRFRASAGTVDADMSATSVRQFYVEESNQNSVQGMVDLVEIQRSYMANLRAMRAMDDVLQTITNSVGTAR